MIKSFKHKGLKLFFQSGKASGIQAKHAKKLRMQLAALDTAHMIEDVDIPGFALHPLETVPVFGLYPSVATGVLLSSFGMVMRTSLTSSHPET